MAGFYGEKVAGAVLGLTWIPAMGLLGVHIPWAAPASLALGVASYFLPNAVLVQKARRGRQELRDGVAEVAVLISLAVAGGAGVDGAFASALSTAPGRFAQELAAVRAAHPREGAHRAVEEVGERFGIPEVISLAATLAATEQGTAVSDALEELAWSTVEERRAEAIASGAQARTRMAMLGAGLIVPGYAALLLLPGLRLALQALRGA
jgi:Flp pilus assembly protein TadB